jgi:hypothetical protein
MADPTGKKITEFPEIATPTPDDVVPGVTDTSTAPMTGKIKLSSIVALLPAASAAEVNTGNETGKYVTPDALAGSTPGTRRVADKYSGTLLVKDGILILNIPSEVWNPSLPYDHVDCEVMVSTAGVTGDTTVQLYAGGHDLLSTPMTIETGEVSSKLAATPAVIDDNYKSMSGIYQVRVDVDAISTTAPIDLIVVLYFRRP